MKVSYCAAAFYLFGRRFDMIVHMELLFQECLYCISNKRGSTIAGGVKQHCLGCHVLEQSLPCLCWLEGDLS